MRGVPLRLEVGPKEIAADVVNAARRDQEGRRSMIPSRDLQINVPAVLDTT